MLFSLFNIFIKYKSYKNNFKLKFKVYNGVIFVVIL